MKKINPHKTDFIRRVTEMSGENIGLCYQCGTCSAICPNGAEMDFLPRQIMKRAQFGLEDDVVQSKTPWVCASCLSCSARCPRGIDIAKVMEAIRLLSLRENTDYVNPRELSGELIASLPQIALISSFRKHTG